MDKYNFNSIGIGVTGALALLYLTVPYDFFYSVKPKEETDVVYAVNEMGMAIQRAESYEAHINQIKEDSNRAEQFIGYTAGMVKATLTEKSHNGKSAVDIMSSGPLDAVSGFSDILSGVPVGNSPNQESKAILEKTLQHVPQTQLDNYDDGISAELGR